MAGSFARRELSYDCPGVTLRDDPALDGSVRGFRAYERSVRLGEGPKVWTFASGEVLRWGVKLRSGFTVEPDQSGHGQNVLLDQRFWLVAHLGPWRVKEPVQVVKVIDETDRKGFAYGTLTGHPVSGEEAFLVTRRDDGGVWLTLRSLTRPSRGRWRITYPALLAAQRVYRRRYVRALASPD